MVTESVFLGDMVSTGKPCPWSGWWVCAHETNVIGGRRRHFDKGQLMPPVVLVSGLPWWRALFIRRPRQLASTVWTLVEYDAHGETVPLIELATMMEAI